MTERYRRREGGKEKGSGGGHRRYKYAKHTREIQTCTRARERRDREGEIDGGWRGDRTGE